MTSTVFWTVGITLSVVLIFWLWTWLKKHSEPEGIPEMVKRTIREGLKAVGREEFIDEQDRLEEAVKDLAARMSHMEKEVNQQNRLEDFSVDLRRRLNRLEQFSTQEVSSPQTPALGMPRSILRLGVRVTVTEAIWKGLGTVNPSDLTDEQIDRVFQGPFCRNCLRSLIAREIAEKGKSVRHQCRHCSLSWRMDPTASTSPLWDFKRELFELLDAEYRATGGIGTRDEL